MTVHPYTCSCPFTRGTVSDIWDRYEIALFMLTRMRDGKWHGLSCIEPSGPDGMTCGEAVDTLLKLGVVEVRHALTPRVSYRWIAGQPIPTAEQFEEAS